MYMGKKIVWLPPPVFIPTITLLQLVLFCVNYFASGSFLVKFLQFRTDCISVATMWTYLTYSLLHIGVGHMFFNLVFLFLIGLGIEMVHGFVSVMILYILGVLAASLSFFCFDCGSLIGATGGVYSLIAASFSTCVMTWNEDWVIFITRFRKNRSPFVYGGKLTRILKMTSILCFWAFDFGHAAYRIYHDIDAGYSVIPHLGGTITGLLLGFVVLKDVKVIRWKVLKVLCASIFFLLMGLGLGVNIAGLRRFAGVISGTTCSKDIIDCSLND